MYPVFFYSSRTCKVHTHTRTQSNYNVVKRSIQWISHHPFHIITCEGFFFVNYRSYRNGMCGVWWVQENVNLQKKVCIQKYTSVMQSMFETSNRFRICIPESPTDIPESHTPLVWGKKIKYVFIKWGLIMLSYDIYQYLVCVKCILTGKNNDRGLCRQTYYS